MLRTRRSPARRVAVLARRQARRFVLVAAVPLLLVACTSTAGPAIDRHPTTRISVPASPSAAQLARGHWVKMAVPPVRLCRPFGVWDGSALVVIESGVAPCHPAAAVYYPAANRWAQIAAPPRAAGRDYFAVWGSGRLVLVSARTGFAVAWSPAANRWLGLPRLPAANMISLTWTGTMFLAITARHGQSAAQAWGLAGGRWQSLPSLPPVWHGRYVGAPAAVADGSVYVLAHEFRGTLRKQNISGSSRLLRLTSSGWTVLPLPRAIPGWSLFLTTVDGSLLATGTGCPILECMEAVGQAAIITPGGRAHAIPLSPPRHLNIPFPDGIATGPNAVVVTYSPGGNTLSGGDHFGAVEIYDAQTGRWLTGPRAPATPPIRAAYWSPYGIVSLGQGGGWLLRPASAGTANAG